jgi:uncharacterized membrane protein (UPF0127 family)
MKIFCGGRLLADKVSIADCFASRFKGLMGKSVIDEGEGLFLARCSAIHCFFMKTTIDAVYLANDLTVLDFETLRPWSIGKKVAKTAHVLELAAGAARVKVGDVLIIVSQ